jgi:hypothetical protein
MVVNFRAREISRGAHKLARIPTLIKKKHLDDLCENIYGQGDNSPDK